jgi:hypothetical protein
MEHSFEEIKMKQTQKTVVINDTEYLIGLFPTRVGLQLQQKLTAENADMSVLAPEIVHAATREGKSINFDIEFAGEYDKLTKLMQEILMFNFGSFLQEGSSEG